MIDLNNYMQEYTNRRINALSQLIDDLLGSLLQVLVASGFKFEDLEIMDIDHAKLAAEEGFDKWYTIVHKKYGELFSMKFKFSYTTKYGDYNQPYEVMTLIPVKTTAADIEKIHAENSFL